QAINVSSWSAASKVSLSFELTDETTGYMGVYLVTTSTSGWVDFTDISITCTSITEIITYTYDSTDSVSDISIAMNSDESALLAELPDTVTVNAIGSDGNPYTFTPDVIWDTSAVTLSAEGTYTATGTYTFNETEYTIDASVIVYDTTEYKVELANAQFELKSSYNWIVSIADTDTSGYKFNDFSQNEWASSDYEAIDFWNASSTSQEFSLKYDINDLDAGSYVLYMITSGEISSGSASITVDGATTTDTVSISTSGWDSWTTYPVEFTLSASGNVTVDLYGTLSDGDYIDIAGFNLYRVGSSVSSKDDMADEYEMVYYDATMYDYDMSAYNAAAEIAAGVVIGEGGSQEHTQSVTLSSVSTQSADYFQLYSLDEELTYGTISYALTASAMGWSGNTYYIVIAKDSSGTDAIRIGQDTRSWSNTSETVGGSYTLSESDTSTPEEYGWIGIEIVGTNSSTWVGGTFTELSATYQSVVTSTITYPADYVQPLLMIGGHWVTANDAVTSGTANGQTYGVINMTSDTASAAGYTQLYPWNYYTGWDTSSGTAQDTATSKAYSSLAKSTLAEDGSIEFNYADGGLFNDDTSVKDIYTNVSIPFYKNGEYYTLDSSLYDVYWGGDGTASSNSALEYNFDKKIMGSETDGYQYKGFFPFDGEDDTQATYNFGMNFSINFYLTNDGKLTTESGDDMVFNFSGDDDVWVYVDGNLLLDIGGIHDAITANINFAEKNATLYADTTYSETTAFSDEVLAALGYSDGSYDTEQVHTLQVYYLERGQAESNAYISFNMLPVDTLTVAKEVSASLLAVAGEDAEYTFHIEKYDKENSQWINALNTVAYSLYTSDGTLINDNMTTDEDGIFTLKADQEAVFVMAKAGLDEGDVIRAVEDTTTANGETFDTSWESKEVSSVSGTTREGKISSRETVEYSETRGIISVAIDNASFNQTVMAPWLTTYADTENFTERLTYYLNTDSEGNVLEGRNYYYELDNSSSETESASGSLSRSIEVTELESGLSYDVSINVKSSSVGDTGLTFSANGVSTNIEAYSVDEWTTYTLSGVVAENGIINISISGQIAAGVIIGIDDLAASVDLSNTTTGSSYIFTCTNSILEILEYFVELAKSSELNIGSEISGVTSYVVSQIDVENGDGNSEVKGRDYTAEISDSTSSGYADTNLNLIYTQNTSTGDYTYNISYDDDNDGITDVIVATVVIHVYETNNDVYVLDYGLATDLADTTYDNGLFENDTLYLASETNATYSGMKVKDSADSFTISDVAGVQGNISNVADTNNITEDAATGKNVYDGQIIYTPTKFMSEIDEFSYEVVVMKSSADTLIENVNGVTMYADVKVMPANTVYYEDNFASSGTTNTDATAGIIYAGGVTTVNDTSGAESTLQGNGLNTNYGYDEAYTDDIKYSNGSATQMDADSGYGMTAEFQFKGTGFEIVSRANQYTTTVLAEVYAVNDGTVATTPTDWAIVNTFYQSGNLYQVPVVSIKDLDYGEYKVILYVVATSNQGTFYLDGIRIYNPAGTDTEVTDNYIANEVGAEFKEIKSMILGEGYSTQKVYENEEDTTGTDVLVAGSGVSATLVSVNIESNTVTTGSGNMYVEDFVGIDDESATTATVTSDYYDYLMKGPNNETYVNAQDAVAFSISGYAALTAESTFQIAAKATGTATQMTVTVIDTEGNILVSPQVTEIGSSTELYYEITLPEAVADGCIIIVQNTGSTILSLTDIKYNGLTLKESDTEAGEDFTAYLTEVTSSVYNAFVSIGVIGSNDDSGYGDNDSNDDTGSETLENTVKAQTSQVIDETYSIRFVGGIDSLDYSEAGFYVGIYGSDGTQLKEEAKKTITSVYTSVKANGSAMTAEQIYGAGTWARYLYTYVYRNVPASGTYYFAVANYTLNYDAEGAAQEQISSYKYYMASGGSLTVVSSIPTAE
ncbi:MAG: hypothetical protein ACI4DS_04505, partial [Eubacterium sp.]